MAQRLSRTRCEAAIAQAKAVTDIPYKLIAAALPVLSEAEIDQPGITTEFIDDTLAENEHLSDIAHGIAQGLGCYSEYLLGRQAVKVVCGHEQCPFYPNGPEA